MKKLLSILGVVSILSAAPSMVTSCNGGTGKKVVINNIKIGEPSGNLIAGQKGIVSFDLTFSEGFEPKQDDLVAKFDNAVSGLKISISVVDKKVTVESDKTCTEGKFSFTITDKTDSNIKVKAIVAVIHPQDTITIGQQSDILKYGIAGKVTFSVTPSNNFNPSINDLSVAFNEPSQAVGLTVSFTDIKTITVSGDTTTKPGSYSFTITDKNDKYFTNAKGTIKVNGEQIELSQDSFTVNHGSTIKPTITNWSEISKFNIKVDQITGNQNIFVDAKGITVDKSNGYLDISMTKNKNITGQATIVLTGDNCDPSYIKINLINASELDYFNESDITLKYKNNKVVPTKTSNTELTVKLEGSLKDYTDYDFALEVNTKLYDNLGCTPNRYFDTQTNLISYIWKKQEMEQYFANKTSVQFILSADNVKNGLTLTLSFSS